MIETELEAQTQLVVLARTLQVPPQHLAPLARLGAAHLSALQQQLLRALHAEHADTFRRITPVVPIFPVGLGVALFERVVPPVLAARFLGAVGIQHPEKCAQALCMVDAVYAADGAPYLDPNVFEQLMRYGRPEPITLIINELLRRRDYLTAARFLSVVNEPLIAALEQTVLDDAGLVYTAAYAYPAHTLSRIVQQLLDGPRRRVPAMLQTVLAGPPSLHHAMLALFCKVEPAVAATLGDIFFGRGSAHEVGRFLLTSVNRNAGPALLTVVGRLNPVALWALSVNPQFADPGVLTALIQSVDGRTEPDPWRGLFALSTRLSEPARRHIATTLADLSPTSIAALPAHATDASYWPALLQLLAEAPPPVQTRIADVWSRLPPEWQAGIDRHIRTNRYETRLNIITNALTTATPEEVFFRRRRQNRQRGEGEFAAW
ncbi:hypothetical protein ACFO5K_15460 [Nocardia halotolerans]|uniref:Uncharacterized protein n=1 Tax=Nocardia halotolerans TaxID=1755878 RepID=A0ABV8VJ09_9NOCA